MEACATELLRWSLRFGKGQPTPSSLKLPSSNLRLFDNLLRAVDLLLFLSLARCIYINHDKRADDIDRNMEDKMEFSTSKEVTVAPTFEDMHLKENLLRGIYAYGYESPSAVQSRAIVQVCKGRDTIAQAQSGTGKTATFSISILQILETSVRETQGKRSQHSHECR